MYITAATNFASFFLNQYTNNVVGAYFEVVHMPTIETNIGSVPISMNTSSWMENDLVSDTVNL